MRLLENYIKESLLLESVLNSKISNIVDKLESLGKKVKVEISKLVTMADMGLGVERPLNKEKRSWINKLKKEWADTGHKLKENPLPEQTKQYEKLCESIKKNGMTHPIIVAGDMRVLRGNQRVWYCIDNNIQMIGAYVIDEGEMDRYIQETYIHKSKYPL